MRGPEEGSETWRLTARRADDRVNWSPVERRLQEKRAKRFLVGFSLILFPPFLPIFIGALDRAHTAEWMGVVVAEGLLVVGLFSFPSVRKRARDWLLVREK